MLAIKLKINQIINKLKTQKERKKNVLKFQIFIKITLKSKFYSNSRLNKAVIIYTCTKQKKKIL